jgi:perosamine synthetase
MLKNWLEVAVTKVLLNPSLYWLPAGLPFLKLGETKFYTDFPIARLDPIRAGLLRRWKRRLANSTTSRVAHSEQILRSLALSNVQTIKPSGRGRSVYLRLPVLMGSRQEKDAVCRISAEQGLGISPLYPSSLQHIAELIDTLSSQDVPQSTMIAERLVTLPTHELVSDSDVVRISSIIQAAERVDGAATIRRPDITNGQRHVPELPRNI